MSTWDGILQRLQRGARILDQMESRHASASFPESLTARAARLARELETARGVESPRGGDGFLEFRVGGERFAIETRHVLEVVRAPRLCALPGPRPAFYVGLGVVRGEIVPIVDLPAFLRDDPGAARCPVDPPWLLAVGQDGAELAFAVDEVGALLPSSPENALVLRGETLLADPRLMVAR